MKTMTCKQLGGACEMQFQAENFEEMAELSKKHGTEMFLKGDEPHLKAMENMKSMMQSPEAMQNWFNSKREEFNSLPED